MVVVVVVVVVDYTLKISPKNPAAPCLYIGKDHKVIGFYKLGHNLFCLIGMKYN